MKLLIPSFFITLSLFVNLNLASAAKIYFSPKDNLSQVIIKNIQKAESSIDISIYTFSSDPIKKALIKKLKNGVKVRILINNGHKQDVASFAKSLKQNGAEIRYVTKINHHKFMIIDNSTSHPTLVNSSGNYSGSNLAKKYDENLVVCSDCLKHLTAFQNEFDSLFYFSNAVHGNNDALHPSEEEKQNPIHKNYKNTALFSSGNFSPYYSRNKIRFKSSGHDRNGTGIVDRAMIKVIDKLPPDSSLKVATGHLRSNPLYLALVRAQNRGVKVQVVLDGQEYISHSKQLKEFNKVKKCMEKKGGKNQANEIDCKKTGAHYGRLLAMAGVDVKFKYYMLRWHYPYAVQMHHKYMIVDNKVVYSGSYNWSYNAEFKTFENVAIYNNQDIIEAFNKNFHNIANYGGDSGFNSLFNKFKNATSSIPTVFNPVSVTYDQIDKLKKLARKKCPNLYKNKIEARSCRF